MSVSVPASDIVDSAIFRLHQTAPATGEFLEPADLLRELNMGVKRLSAKLSRLWGDQHFLQSASLQTDPNQGQVSLPPSCTDLVKLYWVRGSENFPLKRASVHEQTPLGLSQAWDQPPTYALQGSSISFFPTPSETYLLFAQYTTGLTLNSLDDSFSFPVSGCDEWMIADLCEVIRTRQEKPFGEFTQRKYEAEEIIKEHAAHRDRYAEYTVTDVESCSRLDDWRFRGGR